MIKQKKKVEKINLNIIFTPICWLKEFWRTILYNAPWSGHDMRDLRYITTKKGGTIISECMTCGLREKLFIVGESKWQNFLSFHSNHE